MQTAMGCCLTRQSTATVSHCSFFDNKIGDESTLTSSELNTVQHQQTAATAATLEVSNLSMVEAANRRSSAQRTRQAFLDGSLNADPRCPLDARQLYTLAKSWNVINRNLSVTAVNIFVRSGATFFCNRIVKVWNSLPAAADDLVPYR